MSPNKERKIHHEGTKDTKRSVNVANKFLVSVMAQSRRAYAAAQTGEVSAYAPRRLAPQPWLVCRQAFLRVLRAFVVNLLTSVPTGGA